MINGKNRENEMLTVESLRAKAKEQKGSISNNGEVINIGKLSSKESSIQVSLMARRPKTSFTYDIVHSLCDELCVAYWHQIGSLLQTSYM